MADGSGAAPAAEGADAGVDVGVGNGGAAAAGAGTAGAQGPGAGAGTAALAASQAEQPWYGELDEDSLGWLQNKQYFGPDPAKADVRKTFPEFVKAARSLEKLVGDPASRVVIPKDINDKQGWDALYAKLGRPADPTGYELKAGEGGDQAIVDKYAELAHKHGFSARQAREFMPEFVSFAQQLTAERAQAQEQQYHASSAAELDGLRQEWGGQADAKFAAAQRAKIALGMSDEKMDKIERAIGTRDFITLFSTAGMAFSEDRGPGHGENGFAVTTKESARARMNDLKADKNWMQRYLAGGTEEVTEWNRLEKVLAGIR